MKKFIIHNKTDKEFEICVEPLAESYFVPKNKEAHIDMIIGKSAEDEPIHIEYRHDAITLYEERDLSYTITIVWGDWEMDKLFFGNKLKVSI